MENIFTIGVVGIWSLLFNLTSFKKELLIFLGRKIYNRRQLNQANLLHHLLAAFHWKSELFRSWWDSNTGPWGTSILVAKIRFERFFISLSVSLTLYDTIYRSIQPSWPIFINLVHFFSFFNCVDVFVAQKSPILDPFCDFLRYFGFYKLVKPIFDWIALLVLYL